MRIARGAIGLVGAIAVLAVLAAAGLALMRWKPLLSASIDPGQVNFAKLTRESSGGDALICPKSLCQQAKADLDPPIFTSSAMMIEKKLLLYASRSAFIDEIRLDDDPDRLRFVQRSSPFGAPTFVDILIAPRSSGAATVAMYARSGGANSNHDKKLRQLRGWLAAISN